MADRMDKLGGKPQHINSPSPQSYDASTIRNDIPVNNAVDAKAPAPRSCKIPCQILTAHQKKAPSCRASIGRLPAADGFTTTVPPLQHDRNSEHRSADCYPERGSCAGCSVRDRVQEEQRWPRRNKLQLPERRSKMCTPVTDRHLNVSSWTGLFMRSSVPKRHCRCNTYIS